MIQDLALMLIVAGVVTLIFKKLKQPLVLGYIMAGFLVSPHMPLTASVADTENIQTWADIGVLFLLYATVSKTGTWLPYLFLLCGSVVIYVLNRLTENSGGERLSIVLCYAQMLLVCVYAGILSSMPRGCSI